MDLYILEWFHVAQNGYMFNKISYEPAYLSLFLTVY